VADDAQPVTPSQVRKASLSKAKTLPRNFSIPPRENLEAPPPGAPRASLGPPPAFVPPRELPAKPQTTQVAGESAPNIAGKEKNSATLPRNFSYLGEKVSGLNLANLPSRAANTCLLDCVFSQVFRVLPQLT
jgi:hypothetical protein